MSHFAVLVIGDNVEQQLARYHEFECTGTNDQYVQDVDVTEEIAHGIAEGESLEEALDYYSLSDKIVASEAEVQKVGDECPHKYGYAIVRDGQLIKAVNRTNPNKYSWKDENGQEIAVTYGEQKLPFVQENPDRRGEFLLDEKGRLVHLLQGLHQGEQQKAENNRSASEVAHQGDLRNDAGSVRADVGDTAFTMRDLLDATEDADGRVFGGPLPQDREGARPSLPELQSFARALDGKNIHLVPSDSVPGSVITKTWLSGPTWDWWVIGGRWSGFLKLKNGLAGGKTDVAEKGNVDFDGMRDEAGDEAAKRWDKAAAAKVAAGLAENTLWDNWQTVRERHPGEIDDARAEYHAQPAVAAIRKVFDSPFFSVDSLLVTREEYIQEARDSATVLYAIVKDGQWIAKGEMGWWGMSDDKVSEADWNRKVNEMLDALPDDTLITVVDCHI